MNKNEKVISFFVTIFLGIAFGLMPMGGLLLVILIIAMIFLIGGVVFVGGVVERNKKAMTSSITIVAIALLFGISTLFGGFIKGGVKHHIAHVVVEKIYKYKEIHGNFPPTISQIHSIWVGNNFSYQLVEDGKEFELVYLASGIEPVEYSSEKESWND